jgi:hypothetical protein
VTSDRRSEWDRVIGRGPLGQYAASDGDTAVDPSNASWKIVDAMDRPGSRTIRDSPPPRTGSPIGMNAMLARGLLTSPRRSWATGGRRHSLWRRRTLGEPWKWRASGSGSIAHVSIERSARSGA